MIAPVKYHIQTGNNQDIAYPYISNTLHSYNKTYLTADYVQVSKQSKTSTSETNEVLTTGEARNARVSQKTVSRETSDSKKPKKMYIKWRCIYHFHAIVSRTGEMLQVRRSHILAVLIVFSRCPVEEEKKNLPRKSHVT